MGVTQRMFRALTKYLFEIESIVRISAPSLANATNRCPTHTKHSWYRY